MRYRRATVAAAVVASVLTNAAGLRAQEYQPVPQGDTVRVWSPSLGLKGQEATVLVWSAPTARFASLRPPHDSLDVPFAGLTKLEVLDGRNHVRGILTGAGIGGGVGFLLGLLVGEAAVSGCSGFLCELDALGYAGGGMLIGAGVGGAIGAAYPPARWRRVDLPVEAGFPPYRTPWYKRTEVRILSALLGFLLTVALD